MTAEQDEEPLGARAALALDLGGTWLRAALPGEDLTSVERVGVSRSTSAEELGGLVWTLAQRVGLDPDVPVAITLAVPTFATASGQLLACPAIPALTGIVPADLLAATWAERGAPGARPPTVRIVPDIAAAALGESVHGAGRGVDRLLCVALGTGANAAAVLGGEVLDAAYGCLGDAGHVVVEVDGLPCTCGGRGCLETRCSGWALGRAARELGLTDAAGLSAAARCGNVDAAAVLDRAGTALGAAMASWSVLVWPEVIAVAGGLAQAGELLLEPARAALARHAPPYVAESIRVVAAELGPDATLAGCQVLAARQLPARPAATR